jgi:L-cysteine/cystine lyase
MTLIAFDVEAARRELPSTEHCVYFNAGTFGPVCRMTHAAMAAHNDRTLERGRIGTPGGREWLAQPVAARAAFARVLAVDPADLALNHCTTDGINTVLWGLEWHAGDEIVTTTHEHPGLLAPLEELARRTGVVIHKVKPHAGALGAVYTDRTRLLALSHVLWNTGEVVDLASIARAARERGIDVLVDGAQSIGHIPVDVSNSGADFFTVSGQKWLGGPSGTGALWVRRAAQARLGTPWPSYQSRERTLRGVREWETAQRFDATTISMTAFDGLAEALAFHGAQVRLGALDYARMLARTLRSELTEIEGIHVVPLECDGSIISFSHARIGAPELVLALEAQGILARFIPGGSSEPQRVRISVGFWNDTEDCAKLVRALKAL